MENDVRLIDANALDLRNRVVTDVGGLCFIEDVETAIEQASTIDAVPVVRCKDCKYWKLIDEYIPHFECKVFCDWHGRGYTTGADDFCSYGERKDDARESVYQKG